MATHVAVFAPDRMPDIEYTRVNAEQAACIATAMELPENQANFEVTLLPLDTPEQKQAAAEEWASYKQAKGDTVARERGATLVFDGRDESPEGLLRLLEGQDDKTFAVHALLKAVKLKPQASIYDLLSSYYNDPK